MRWRAMRCSRCAASYPWGTARPASRVRPATNPTRPPSAATSSATACTPPPATRPGWGAGGQGGPRPTSAPGCRPACWCWTSTRATAAWGSSPSSSASTGRCHPPGSASRAAVTAASTAGSSIPAGAVSGRGWAAAWTSRPTAAMCSCPRRRHPATGQPYIWAEPTLDPAALPADVAAAAGPTPQPAPAARRPASQPRARGGSVAEAFNHDQLDPGARPPRLELPRPRPRRRRRPLAPPWRHQPQERHHPPRPAVRLLRRHPLPANRGRGAPWLQPLPRLRRAGARRGPARRRPSPPGRRPGDRGGRPTHPHHPRRWTAPGCWASCTPPSPAM